MRQTAAHRSYLGSAGVLSRHGQAPDCRTTAPAVRRGFTLIEVVVAMSILVIVVLALLSSYAFYYRTITNLRIQSIGENLAQLQLEDVRNMGIASYQAVLGGKWNGTSPSGMWPARYPANYDCPNYPPAELYYWSTSSGVTLLGWFSYARRVFPDGSNPGDPTMAIGLGNRPAVWSDVNGLIPPRSNVSDVTSAVENLASITYDDIYRPVEYDSGKRDADFVIEGLGGFTISGVSRSPSDLVLPDSITVASSASGTAPYTLDISKWTYPYYKKRITITDKSLTETQLAKKRYEVAVTVYWTANGANKSVTVKQEVSFEGQM